LIAKDFSPVRAGILLTVGKSAGKAATQIWKVWFGARDRT
jgi:hypothetical protein